MTERRPQLLCALVFAAASALFAVLVQPGLGGPLVLDSVKLYALGDLLHQYGNLAVLHTPGFDGGLNRIVSMASFVLDVQAQQDVSALRFKATNVMLHIATAGVVYFFLRTLLRATPRAADAEFIALATSVIWLLSPLNANVVLYAVQRMAMLSALFVIAGLLLYTAARLEERRGRSRLLAAGAVACLPLAVLSKENGVLLVPLALLVEIYVLHAVRPRFALRRLLGAALAGIGAVTVIALLLMPALVDYGSRDFTLVERVLSQPRALLGYAAELLLPLDADTGVYTDGFAASRGLWTPPATAAALLACLCAAALCVRLWRGRFALAGFGLAFFLIGHGIESSFIALELYFPHRNYLPGLGLYLALIAVGTELLPRRSLAAALLAAYGAYFALLDHARATTWSSRETIAMAAVSHQPQSARAWSEFAQRATDSAQYELADQAAARALELSGAAANRLQRLYIRCAAGADIAPADYDALRTHRGFGVANELSQALANVLQLYARGGCPQLDVAALGAALDGLSANYAAAGGDDWTVQYYVAALQYAAGERQPAHARLQRRLDAGHLESGIVRLEWLIEEARDAEARQMLQRLRQDAAGRRDVDAMLDELERHIAE